MERTYKTAHDVFTKTLDEMMEEVHLGYGSCTVDEVDVTIALATKEFNHCWEELLLFALYGEDKQAKTRGLLRAKMKQARQQNQLF